MTNLEKKLLAELCANKLITESRWEWSDDAIRETILDVCYSMDIEIEDEELAEVSALVEDQE